MQRSESGSKEHLQPSIEEIAAGQPADDIERRAGEDAGGTLEPHVLTYGDRADHAGECGRVRRVVDAEYTQRAGLTRERPVGGEDERDVGPLDLLVAPTPSPQGVRGNPIIAGLAIDADSSRQRTSRHAPDEPCGLQ